MKKKIEEKTPHPFSGADAGHCHPNVSQSAKTPKRGCREYLRCSYREGGRKKKKNCEGMLCVVYDTHWVGKKNKKKNKNKNSKLDQKKKVPREVVREQEREEESGRGLWRGKSMGEKGGGRFMFFFFCFF